jgi:hypothetical protein
MSVANSMENKVLDAIFNNVSLAIAQPYVKLHTGDPGEDGTANAATETTRKALSTGAASGGTVTSDADLAWTNVAATETYTHVSIWDASVAGNCIWTGALAVSKAVVATDNFTIPSGSLTVSLD